jgi:hypothetical protein
MARMKKPIQKGQEAAVKKPEAKSKAKIGPMDRKTIGVALERLAVITGKLKALDLIMKESKPALEEITMEGPKLLPRGVNSLLSFVKRLTSALEDRDKM